ncbi:uncharacterized protein LOC101452559 [Ceratitis capitata]|uniref:uncharacterized protein LOC101452559 n=1 Tax=Ceratitis capitata TaxID=7213 RepID=UPI00032A3535|nr:uncharacterized protein LOC101452559 [Ceratitis capitata]
MYKNWSILFLAAFLALQLVASLPQRDSFESLDYLSEESPEIEIYQRRQSRQPDDLDDTIGILNEENSVLKEIFRKIALKYLGKAKIQSAVGDGVLKLIKKKKFL